MKHEFDAIIVGAGMGGLCAAAYLVAGGKRVAVVEKSPHLGGRCSHRDQRGLPGDNRGAHDSHGARQRHSTSL